MKRRKGLHREGERERKKGRKKESKTRMEIGKESTK